MAFTITGPEEFIACFITNPDCKTKSVLSLSCARTQTLKHNYRAFQISFLLLKLMGRKRKKTNEQFFHVKFRKILPWTQIFHVKISFRKAKFEILFPNDMIKLEIIKGIVILCLLNHFFTNINKNLKRSTKEYFSIGHYSLRYFMISLKLNIQRYYWSRNANKLLSNQKSTNSKKVYLHWGLQHQEEQITLFSSKKRQCGSNAESFYQKGPKDSLALN